MIYIIVFIVSLFFLFISLYSKNVIMKNFMLLSGIRDYSMCVDTDVYIRPLFYHALKSNNVIEYIFNNQMMTDYLYLTTTFFVSKIFKNMFFIFCINELLTIVPIYIALKNTFDDKKKIIFGMFLFFMVMYNPSFNMTRQSIALSFEILSLSYLMNKKYNKMILNSLIAFGYHWSACIIVPIIFLKLFIKDNDLKLSKKLILMLIVFLLFILIVFFPKVIHLLNYSGLLNNKLVSFTSKYTLSHIEMNNTADTLFFVTIFILLLVFKKILKQNNQNYTFFYYLLLYGIIFIQIGSIIKYAHRISYYLIYPVLFLELPNLFKTKNKYTYIDLIFILMFNFYWYFWTVIANYHHTFPFVFR